MKNKKVAYKYLGASWITSPLVRFFKLAISLKALGRTEENSSSRFLITVWSTTEIRRDETLDGSSGPLPLGSMTSRGSFIEGNREGK